METDDGYPCGEHDITHRDVGSLRHSPEINVTLYVNYTKKKSGQALVISMLCLLMV